MAAVSLSLVVAVALPVGAQSPADAVRPGVLTSRVVSASDSLRSYSLFIPASFDSTRTWPVLILMDPRGRAMIPMERVRPAAEQYGWIVMSSYDTRSDDPNAPNVDAANAMLADAQAFLHPDTKRFYFAGFSGTARLAWDFAANLDGVVAGIIASGAGVQRAPQWLLTPGLPRPAFYGTAGVTDFNYDEVRELENWLERAHFDWRTRYFPGGHEWMPDSLFQQAVPWMELQAMRDSLTVIRPPFVDSMYAHAVEGARHVDRPVDARDRYREIVRDFRGLRDTTVVAAALDSLARTKEVKRALEERERIARDAARYNGRLAEFLQDMRTSERPPSLANALARLDIDRLLRESRDEADPERALAARRMLESAFVNLSFYSPNEALTGGYPRHALVMLDAADRIHPDRPNVQLTRARALIELGRNDAAMDALEGAVRAGVNPRTLAADPAYASLRGMPRFESLTGR